MSVVILRDEIVHYEVLGRGRPLIFLHGWVGSWRYWIPNMQSASMSFRSYAIDFWGFGDTGKNPSYYNLENQVNLLDQFLQELGIGKVALVGHGLGGVIALLYAAKFKKQVDRVMLVGIPNGSSLINPRLATTPPAELAEWLVARSPGGEAARSEAPKSDPKAIQLSVQNLQGFKLSMFSNYLEAPCLVVHGQNDPLLGPPPQELNGLPDNIHQIIFEQSGHFPMLDETNKFNRLLADFLSLGSGVSPRQLQLKDEWRRRVR